MWTKEKQDYLIKHYESKTLDQISKDLKMSHPALTYHVNLLCAEGLLTRKKADRVRADMLHDIAEDYKKGMNVIQLSIKYQRTEGTITKYLRDLSVAGVIHFTTRKEKPKKTKKVEKKRTEIPEKLEKGQTIDCDSLVSFNCVYGVNKPSESGEKCRYMLCEGHKRGCLSCQCDKFIKLNSECERKKIILEDEVYIAEETV